MRTVGILLSLVLLSSLVVPVAMAQEQYNRTETDVITWTENPRIEFQGATIAWIGESEWRTVILAFPEDLQQNFIATVMNEIQICDPLVPDYNPNAVSAPLTEFNMCADENSNPEKFDSEVHNGINEIKRQNEYLIEQNENSWKITVIIGFILGIVFLSIDIVMRNPTSKKYQAVND